MASFMVFWGTRREEKKGKKAKWPWLDQESKQGDHVCHKDEKSIDGGLQWERIDQLECPLKVRNRMHRRDEMDTWKWHVPGSVRVKVRATPAPHLQQSPNAKPTYKGA